ncbi:glutamine amidotransferase [Tersicoccus solisilvae]|uniref:Glutamine amidotransferase n=1 Tax=Tersicoccus solisilvae TaxID=1882339 RepID=A0ABQ1NI75_9MICC|nr:glutamine amidotransferase [Tersicoccus solisilvae]GGC77766.1 glutamine amidotransferase [Tersicoccus solisilvae]
MKPFLLLSTRDHDAAAAGELASFLTHSGLPPERLDRIRLVLEPDADIELGRYAGVFLGGSPFNSSDPLEQKSDVQVAVEARLRQLLDTIVAEDLPFLGACYGVGTLGVFAGGVVDRTYAEPISAVRVTLTDAAAADPLCAGLPAAFDAYVGHKEAVRELPPGAVLLGSSTACPVQMFRLKQNLYATQFHPELDAGALAQRIDVYKYAGYFPPETAEELKAEVAAADVEASHAILRRFVELYG